MLLKIAGASVLAGLCLCAGPALADCANQSIITSVDLAKTDDIRPFVPVTFGDKQKLMLIHTGAVTTEMTQKAVDQLGLTPTLGPSKSYNFENNAAIRVAQTPLSDDQPRSFVHTPMKLGWLTTKNMSFAVLPDDKLLSNVPSAAGLIAPDVLSNYDLEIDFGGRKLNLLSQDHCEGKVVYWPSTTLAIVPFTMMASRHIQFTVKLDGQDVIADLDTGALDTTLTRSAAAGFGLTLGDADTPSVGDLPGNATGVYKHIFKTLEIGGVVISNPHVMIIPDLTRMARAAAGAPHVGTRLSDKRLDETDQAMLIGMNILQHLHIYIAYNEKKLYFTEAGPAPAVDAGQNGSTARAH